MSVNKLQYLTGFLIGTNVYIAFIATVISIVGFLLFKTEHFWTNTGFVFFATQSAYNLQRYFKWRNNHLHEFLKPFVPAKKESWYVLIGISAVAMISFMFYLNLQQFIMLGLICIPTGLYVFIHPTQKKLTGLRYIPFIKTFLVAFCWTAMFFTLTHSIHHLEVIKNFWPYWLIVFLQVWQACILFDLRDLEIDKNELKTFANSLSKNGLFAFWLALFLTIVILSASYGLGLVEIPVYLAVATIQLICIYKKFSELNFTFMVDGSLVLYALANFMVFVKH